MTLNHQTCEQRQVSHFQYLSWPDYGVPTSAVTLIDFLGAGKRQQKKMVKALGLQWTGHPQGPPIVVHCSAGIGRTGELTTNRGVHCHWPHDLIRQSMIRLQDASQCFTSSVFYISKHGFFFTELTWRSFNHNATLRLGFVTWLSNIFWLSYRLSYCTKSIQHQILEIFFLCM